MTRILIVDDHPSNREYLRTLLTYAGHDVSEACDGTEGLERANADHPDLIVSDILMPTMDGFEFVQRLRGETSLASIPMIFYTGTYQLPQAQRLAEACGVCRVLQKPSPPQLILEAVSESIGKAIPNPPILAPDSFHDAHEKLVLLRLSRKLDSLGSRLAALIESSIELTSYHDSAPLLQRVCRAARAIFDCRAACIELVSDAPGRDRAIFVDGLGPEAAARIGTVRRPSEVDRASLVERRVLRIQTAKADSTMRPWLEQFPAAEELLVIPMGSPLQIFGLIYLVGKPNSKPLQEDEERLAVALAAIAGRCFESCSLHSGLESRAVTLTDELAQRSGELERTNRSLESELALHSAANDELRRMQVQLGNQNRHLLELTKLAGDFVDQVSHDFRSPLSVIKESASLLFEGQLGPVSEEQKSFLAMLMDRSSHLAVMVDDLLDMSRLNAGILPMHRGYITAEALFDRLQATLQHKALANQITLVLEPGDGLPEIYCDPEKVGRAITNLATNSIKFCKEGAVVRIWARMDSDPGRVRIGVTDNGPGIAEEDLRRLFEKFAQVPGAAKAQQGFGLGLSIVRDLIHINLGEIQVESELRKGSTFSFALPCGRPASVVASYLSKVKPPPIGPEALSLLRAEVADREADVETFLQQLLRHTDLLFRAGDGRWLIVAHCDETGADQLIERVERTRLGVNRNRPQGGFPVIHWQKLDYWKGRADNSRFSQAVENGCRTMEAVHV